MCKQVILTENVYVLIFIKSFLSKTKLDKIQCINTLLTEKCLCINFHQVLFKINTL